ncbi:MAG: hypothetical protein R3F40_17790 [Candidatus Competibacteraceae bacterium]
MTRARQTLARADRYAKRGQPARSGRATAGVLTSEAQVKKAKARWKRRD